MNNILDILFTCFIIANLYYKLFGEFIKGLFFFEFLINMKIMVLIAIIGNIIDL